MALLILNSVKLTKLSSVVGAMNVQSSAQFDCSTINGFGQSGSQVVRGAITCQGAEAQVGNPSSAPSGTGSSSASQTSKALAVPLTVPTLVGGTGILAGLLQLLLSL